MFDIGQIYFVNILFYQEKQEKQLPIEQLDVLSQLKTGS